ncbi:MAG: transporter substrate-binding domain-containing protein [Thiothrix sp.]|nr:transporter substrate-binding domain-containing protein [Thiothrix sp.]HPQ94738.1 transporter substrate-binding domain-containing protein [Thiolinea sp.]
MKFRFVFMLVSGLMLACPFSVWSAEYRCGQPYEVVAGDTLGSVAEKVYGSSIKYNLIFYANRGLLAEGPSVIKVGQKLRIPCEQAEADGPAPEPAPAAVETSPVTGSDARLAVMVTVPDANRPGYDSQQVIQLLTAGDYAPFTDQSLPQGGLITELVEQALTATGIRFQLTWINDWSAHLDPLLKQKKYDMGFPWFYPGCPGKDTLRCEFLFSKPVFEVLIVLFTRTDSTLVFEKDRDLEGKRLCRPAGYFTHDLERAGREWLSGKVIELKQPHSVKDCFDLLLAGEVDGVTTDDFTGRDALARLGYQDRITPQAREISVEALSVVVHKTHPRATILINRVNQGLAALHESGRYDEIMDRHLLAHWSRVETLQPESR